MIIETTGDLLKADADALVNAVNTVGVMGKGIALQFRETYPECFKSYKIACQTGELTAGKMHVFATGNVTNPRYIINFPTKRHWRDKSRLEDIKSGLKALTQTIKDHKINSIAIPPLGCGNGGLDWQEVRILVEAFAEISAVKILLYIQQ